jgi:hypothetical protein
MRLVRVKFLATTTSPFQGRAAKVTLSLLKFALGSLNYALSHREWRLGIAAYELSHDGHSPKAAVPLTQSLLEAAVSLTRSLLEAAYLTSVLSHLL